MKNSETVNPFFRSYVFLRNGYYIYFAFFLFGIILSLTSYESGSFIARGDTYPKVNSIDMFLKSFYIWSEEHFGYFNPASTVIYHWGLWALLEIIFEASLGQAIFYGLMIGGAMLSVYLLVLKFFQSKVAAILASFFYVFNFFYVNYSIAQTISYAMFFMPLLVLLSANIVEKMKKSSSHRRETFSFIIAISIVVPILYLNPGALYATLITVTSFWLFYFLVNKGIRRQVVTNLLLISGLSIISLSWFIYVNYTYIVTSNSSLEFVTEENWQWTHARLTLANILKLDGAWGWEDYRSSSYKEFYEHPFLLTTSYIPIALSMSAIAFAIFYRDNNFSYILFFFISMAIIIIFLANTTNVLGQFVYEVLPLSFVFREPYTKLLPPLILFMSLLIAYSIRTIMSRVSVVSQVYLAKKHSWFKGSVAIIIASLLLVNGSQLIGKNHLEAMILTGYEDKFDIYSRPPDYWKAASTWINQQPGDWKVLFLPNNDFYQMPYDWKYYGVDFLPLYIEKPVVMQQYSYLLPSETTDSIGLIYKTVLADDAETFQHLLNLHHIRYIVQRNDIIHDFGNRNILDPSTIEDFLVSQNEIAKVQQFGKLDVYEYKNLGAVMLSADIVTGKTDSITNFDTFDGWNSNLPNMQHVDISQDSANNVMTITLEERPSVWATVNSPLLLASYYSNYDWQLNIEAEDVHQLHIKVAEYDANQKFLGSNYVLNVGDGTINSMTISIPYVPENQQVAFMRLQIWHGYNTTTMLPNIIRISDVRLLEERPSIISANNDDSMSSEEPYRFKVSPTLYYFSVRSNMSSLLILDQAYDPLWQARIGTEIIPSQPVYGIFNGFLIEDDSIYEEVKVEYSPQQTFVILLILSLITMIIYALISIRPSVVDRIINSFRIIRFRVSDSLR